MANKNYSASEYFTNLAEQQKNKNDTCYRCGREGHFSNDCYATKHINGKYL